MPSETSPTPPVHSRREGSQASQDLFALGASGYKRDGFYLEIGCGSPTHENNSRLLDLLGWRGISMDILPLAEEWKCSCNRFIQADATAFDPVEYVKMLPGYVDYLSLDVDEKTNKALRRIPFGAVLFGAITIEHDWYHRKNLRDEQREYLAWCGYARVCSDIMLDGLLPFEDWWVSPHIDKRIRLESMHHAEAIAALGYKSDREKILKEAGL